MKRRRAVKMRSHRTARQMLMVFGTSGLLLGISLVGYCTLRRNGFLIRVGGVYILVSTLLLGIRGVLAHVDEVRHRQQGMTSRNGVQER